MNNYAPDPSAAQLILSIIALCIGGVVVQAIDAWDHKRKREELDSLDNYDDRHD